MADVAATLPSTKRNYGENECLLVAWETLTSTNVAGSAVQYGNYADRTVHILGTFDSATVVIQGSNDGTNWLTLTDPQGNAISKTSAAIESISECPKYIRPSTSGGGASQDIDVLLFMRK